MAKTSQTKYTRIGVENKLDSLDQKLESVDTHLGNIAITLEKNTVSLTEHMRRSDHLETLVNEIRDKEIKPLTKHVHMVQGGLKLLGLVSLIITIAGGIARFFGLV